MSKVRVPRRGICMCEIEYPCGWVSTLPVFRDASAREVTSRLESFVTDASEEQIRAWRASIPPLQVEAGEVIIGNAAAGDFSAVLEYELPMDLRRPDVILLVDGAVVVLELKGKTTPSQADLDQVAAYARDLRCYHRDCHDRPVHPVLIPTRARGYMGETDGVHVAGPDYLDQLIPQLQRAHASGPMCSDSFLQMEAYCPLPTLVQAARELMQSGTIREIHKARAMTQPAVDAISAIIHDAARTRTRRLVLLTGIPGAGKTLVGLQVAHAHFLDDLAIARNGSRPTVPAVFLSGNGPLVQVLQYQLKGAGGGGQTFVRDVKKYVSRYSSRKGAVPSEHVLIFDEAQRAWDADQVRAKHKGSAAGLRSEPELFIEFAERIPEWCVVVGLIGGGQEIHVGEEGGIGQWRDAIEGCGDPRAWLIHGPERLRHAFGDLGSIYQCNPELNLDQEIRFHLAKDIHRFVAELLDGTSAEEVRVIAERLEGATYHLRITRDLDAARGYLRERYAEHPEARFGMVASSRDRDLEQFGVPNGFQDTKRIKFGPWYADAEGDQRQLSCRHLTDCITEFGAQGLELDAALLAWGTDLMWTECGWSIDRARRYQKKGQVKDPRQLRINAYRVLLTRGRDATVVYVPPLEELDLTFQHLVESGFRPLL
ncbi:MAG: DUF2075 domain-containing protein [Phycisphaerales bacterium]|nr:DUF2075 domain-containing protein [Phycisphaerales bacterium]